MTKDIARFKEEFGDKKGIEIFGKNLSDIKCSRNSFIYGICGGVIAGLVCFMVTSKGKLSSHVAFGSIWIGVFAYWIPCRYKWEGQALKMEYYKKQLASKKKSPDKYE